MRRESRPTFKYQPDDPTARNLRWRLLIESIRAWFFSGVGLICSWVLAVGLLVPTAVVAILTLHERVSLSLLALGMWWLAGLIVIHWWAVPPARKATERTEGLASAGWHVVLTILATGIVAWLTIFRDGISSAFALRDTRLTLLSWAAFTLVFGALVIVSRGHTTERTIRYSAFAAAVGAAWLAIWLVTAHSGF